MKELLDYLDSLLFRVHRDMQKRDSELSFDQYLAQESLIKEIKEHIENGLVQ